VALIVQNKDDFGWFVDGLGLGDARVRLIRGAGIDLQQYPFSQEPARRPLRVVMVARLLRDKGVMEYLRAVDMVRARGLDAEFVLVGDPDTMNPNTLTMEEVERLAQPARVSCWGRRTDIADIWREAHISVLPSYREGLPKSLLESAAVGRAIVTTDVPGCREVVLDGFNGFLVPARDTATLAERIIQLLQDDELRRQFGQRSRIKAEAEFASEAVIADTIALYN
jgi:glycosyltransferase involved in cell wall biosynthesis